MSAEFPSCLVCWLGPIWVEVLKICFQADFADKIIALLLCAREAMGKADDGTGGIPFT